MRTTITKSTVDGLTASSAGATLGTVPMLWSSLVTIGPLDLRPAHAFGLLTLALVLLPRSSARIRTHNAACLGVIGTLALVGAATNALVHVDAFWPTSELVRLVVNLVIALAVCSAIPFRDDAGIRAMGWATSCGLGWSLFVWLSAIAGTAPGLSGAIADVLLGRNHHLLYEIQLPAMRTLYHDEILLGTRHGIVFGFLVAAALLHLLTGAVDDRRLRIVARSLATVVLFTTVLSSSRSAFAALIIATLSYGLSRRRELARLGWSYAAIAAVVVIGGTSVASGLVARFTQDTASFRSRQGDASTLLQADWSIAGLPALDPEMNSPHNSFIEMAAGGGIAGLLAATLIAAIATAGLWPRRSTGFTVILLAAVVLVRGVTAARGSLDTAALLALAVVVMATPWPNVQRARSDTKARPLVGRSTPLLRGVE